MKLRKYVLVEDVVVEELLRALSSIVLIASHQRTIPHWLVGPLDHAKSVLSRAEVEQ